MIPLPPISTLFPYTTLFRSEPHSRLAAFCAVYAAETPNVKCLDNSTVRLDLEDRKSTRLNSSHLGISYAVFCLKKKKKQLKTCDGVRHESQEVLPGQCYCRN